jgi:RNA polymerase sigma-70 factor (ECF subfamily)
MDHNDREIITGLKDPDTRERAFNRLVERYQERLYWHIRKIILSHDDADDVLQNLFLKVWKNIDNFREESSLYTWLYRIATNESITFLNSKKRKNMLPLNDISEYLKENLESDPYFDGDYLQMKLQKAIIKLPEKQRIVFNMRYFNEMKYEEMSKILGTSVGALKASFFHAVNKVEEYIKNSE